MCFLGTDELLLGTISWMLVSIDLHKHEQIWQIQLHDAILSVCCYDDDDIMATRLFSGLADGTIAVTEVMHRSTLDMEHHNYNITTDLKCRIYTCCNFAPVI